MPWFTQEYAGALAYMNLGAPVTVATPGDLNQALANGDVDVIPMRMREAFAAGYELQRERPELGLAAFRRRFPDVSEEHACANWALHEPYVFDGDAPGRMEMARWQKTIAYTAATHGLSIVPGERMYRPELVAPALERCREPARADRRRERGGRPGRVS